MKLSVNVDHVATLREARGGVEPDPVHAAVLAEVAGADGIVAHLREDRRHINDRDVNALRDILTKKFDLEMAPTSEMVRIALELIPDMVTLVPEKRAERTTEGGLNVVEQAELLRDLIMQFHDSGISVSLFVESEPILIETAASIGADMVELHTGPYANSVTRSDAEQHLRTLVQATSLAQEYGLIVKAGHGLNLRNLPPIAAIPGIEEVSIGHALISHAVFVGMDRAVRDYLMVLRRVPTE